MVVNDHRMVIGRWIRARRAPYAIGHNVAFVVENRDGHLDVFPGGLAAFFELSSLQRQIQVVSYVARHYDVRETHLFGGRHVFERQWVLLAYLP